MESDTTLLKSLYQHFNAKNIDAILPLLTEDVMWANGMDGGYVQGHEGIRAYWTRQWSVVDPHVEPLSFSKAENGAIMVTVRQIIRDLHGHPLVDQTHGLQDKTVGHIFSLQGSRVSRFDILDVPQNAA